MQSNNLKKFEDDLDFFDFALIYWLNKWLVIAVFTITFFLGAVFCLETDDFFLGASLDLEATFSVIFVDDNLSICINV